MVELVEKSILRKMAASVPNFNHGALNSYKLTRKNIQFIKVAYKMGNILSTTPWYDFKERDFVSPVINVIYAILLIVVLTSVFWLTIDSRDYLGEQMVHKFLSTFSDVISIVLTNVSIIQATFFKRESWKILLDLFTEIDNKLDNNFKEQYKIISNFYLQLLLGHIFFIGCYVYKAYIWSSILGMKYFFSFGTMVIPMYYCFFLTMLSSNLALAFECRFKDLNVMLTKKVQIALDDANHFVKDIRIIRKYYRHLGDAVEVFNEIFGWIIVLTILHAIIELLNCVNLILKSFVDPTFYWGVFMSCLWVCSISMGGSIYIILCCDSASAEGRKLIRFCYKYVEEFESSWACRQELKSLADFSKSYSPNFIAANFFFVERSSILGIISIATTYLIVVIQFNGTLIKNY